ncbi:MAG TPA: SPOR domain-containing protein [Anaeromyxobacter sp.]
MRDPNPRVRAREKFELSLDGRQVASIVVGALVVLGVVFVLGLNVGKQLAVRQVAAGRAGDLEALDRAPTPPPSKPEPLTFHDRLTKETPAPPPPPEPTARPVPPPVPPAPQQAVAPPAAPEPAAPPVAPAQPAAKPGALKPWTVQLAASEERSEAERLATRFSSLNPRIEEAVIAGKGRFYRVRVGSFDTKEAAQRYLRDVARETGAKGIVTPSR